MPVDRPEIHLLSVDALVSAVLSGQIRIPQVGRVNPWDMRDAHELLDSMYRGYPVGTLLLWQRPAAADRMVYGSVVVDAPAHRDALTVFDGQQRALALVRALVGAGHPEEAFAGYFDLAARRIVRPGDGEAIRTHYLPLTEVLRPERLAAWLGQRKRTPTEREAAERFAANIRDYPVAIFVIATADDREIREILRRTHRTNEHMDEDTFLSEITVRVDLRPTSTDGVIKALRTLGFGRMDTILQQLFAQIPDGNAVLRRDLGLLEQAARSAIVFLRRDAGIPHAALVPYPLSVVSLIYFFFRFPEPTARTRELLARWWWRGSLVRGEENPVLCGAEVIAAITRAPDEHTAVQALLARAPTERVDWTARPAGPDGQSNVDLSQPGVWRRIQALALLDLKPRDLRSGQQIHRATDEVPDLEREDAEFPLIRRIFDFQIGKADDFANRIIHPNVAGGIFKAIQGCRTRSWLVSHAISSEATAALAGGDFSAFLRLRARELAAVMQEFSERRAQWDELDSPPVEALQVGSD